LWDLTYNSAVASCGMELNRVKSGFKLFSCDNQALEVPTRQEQNFPQKEQKLRFLPVG